MIEFIKKERIEGFFNSEDWSERKNEAAVLRMMVYLSVFNNENNFSVVELIELPHLSRYKINQIMHRLEEESAVQLVSQRPKEYQIADEFWEKALVY